MRELSLGAGAPLWLLLTASQLGCNWLLDIDKEYSIAQEPGPSGTTTSSTGPSAPCVPSESGAPVADECGVFVSSSYGEDTNAGTKELPVASLKIAAERAQALGKPIYACAEPFDEAVELPGGVSLFGGLDCTWNWGYGGDSKKTVIAPVVMADPPPIGDVIPLKVLGNGDTRIENVDVRAPDAVLPGGSSIAVLVENATVAIANCTFTAGVAKDGGKGATPTESLGPSDPNSTDIRGQNGKNACFADPTGTPGGLGKASAVCATSTGGNGGKGGIAVGDGQKGDDGMPAGSGKGVGGTGDTGSGCETGAPGQLGAPGTPGKGAIELGTFSSSGFVGAAGAAGTPGSPGQGGGGGGGARGKASCNGASGGGGGAGGCGGGGGLGGQAGGASIALLSLNAELSFEGVTLKAGQGGAGGEGGDGQGGGKGGNGGDGGFGAPDPGSTLDACNGGKGGQGGAGGKGGGGRGGHSFGIAFKGKAPGSEGVSITIGAAGPGGVGVDDTGKGADGQEAQAFQFKD